MAENEGTRQTEEAKVVCQTPDVCLTPIGDKKVPVPYQIIATFEKVEEVSNNVRFTRMQVFTVDSRITEVTGDEPGKDGGLVSTCNVGYVKAVTHSTTVRVNKAWVVYNDSLMEMNCDGREGAGNTQGRVVYMKVSQMTVINDDGSFSGETNPTMEVEPEELPWYERAWNATKEAAGEAWEFTKELNSEYKLVERGLGVLQTGGGIGEMVLGAIGVVAPEPVTTGLGAVAVAHGADTTWAGLNQIWTGEFQSTFTEQGATALAEAAGASEGTAGWVGTGVDFVAGLNPGSMGSNIAQEAAEQAAREAAERAAREAAERAAQEAAERAAREAAERAAQEAAEKAAQEAAEKAAQEAAEKAAQEAAEKAAQEAAEKAAQEAAEKAAQETAEEATEEAAERAAQEAGEQTAQEAGEAAAENGVRVTKKKKKKKSKREQYMGRTPGKKSRTGREVQERMAAEGKLRELPDGTKEVLGPDGKWYPIDETDMGHLRDAVEYWNTEGYQYGAKSQEVRDFMLDPDNYELEPSSINRSRGATLGQTQRYRDPAPPSGGGTSGGGSTSGGSSGGGSSGGGSTSGGSSGGGSSGSGSGGGG
ncbi:DUF4150 domain-containing protein [Sulfidibacter corallicola]|uniref:DUF4150 domain-containing protein n=1 Tax=Sulfidibacter corallicola TaxID=2818388 RepID=A0A8A4THW4_SULCO|nr:PAAR-like domain-containing protein [Sulfidibacter corallicola]QTD49516.1 DUF4150 domain-containing protein [Sulfidibacter corallicola]